MLMLDHLPRLPKQNTPPPFSLPTQMQNPNATRVVLPLLHFQAHGAVSFHANWWYNAALDDEDAGFPKCKNFIPYQGIVGRS